MIKEFEIGEKVSFQGNGDHEPLDQTVISWVDNKLYQAIIEHPDGHSGEEIPGKGLDRKGTYVFVKTDHLHEISEGDEEVEEVVAEKINEGSGEIQPNRTSEKEEVVKGKPVVIVSEQLQIFKDAVNEENHVLIDQLIQFANEYESDEAAEVKIPVVSSEEKIDAIKNKEQSEIAAADLMNEGVAERLKRQAKQRQEIQEFINQAKEAGRLEYVKNDSDKSGKAALAVFDGRVLVDNLTLDNKDLADLELSNYFQNVPDEFTTFVLHLSQVAPAKDVAAGGPEDDESDTDVPKNDTDVSNGDTDEEKNENPITYKKKGDEEAPAEEQTKHSEDDEDEPAEEDGGPDLKAVYRDKLLDLNGVGGSMANTIMEIYPTPEDLIKGCKDKAFKFNVRVNAALDSACQTDYFN